MSPLVLIAVFVSGLLVGFTGFGFNLLAVPLLALLSPTKDAVIIALLLGAVISVSMSMFYRHHVQGRVLGGLLVASFPGLLLGAFVFVIISPDVLRVVIGVLTLVFAISMIRWDVQVPATPRIVLTAGAGLVSGALTVTTGMGGPPIVAYLMVDVGDTDRMRATLVLYTGLVSIAALCLLGAAGGISSELLGRATMLAPFGLAGLASGVLLFRKVPQFYGKAVVAVLVLVGINGTLLAAL